MKHYQDLKYYKKT